MGGRVGRVGICTLDGVAHTWGGCGYAPYEEGFLPHGPAEASSMRASLVYSIEQCAACSRQLEAGGGISRWMLAQIAPYAALKEWQSGSISTGSAIARIFPTDLIRSEGVDFLLGYFEGKTPLRTGEAAVLDRRRVKPGQEALLENGVHGAGGKSVVSGVGIWEQGNLTPLGVCEDIRHATSAALSYLALESGWKGEKALLWEAALAMNPAGPLCAEK